MVTNRTFGAGIWLFGQFVDRYATDAYGPPVATLTAIDRAGDVGGLVALDVNYPFSDPGITTAQVKAALERNRFRQSRLRRRFIRGSFSAEASRIRRPPSGEKRLIWRNARLRWPANAQQLIGSLSGGNQQKVVVAKALLTGLKVLLLDEPTRGIDVGAKAEMFEIMRRLAHTGLGVIFSSSELMEVLALADRIPVVSKGKITGEFDRAEATEAALVAASGVGHGTRHMEHPYARN